MTVEPIEDDLPPVEQPLPAVEQPTLPPSDYAADTDPVTAQDPEAGYQVDER